MAIVCRNRSSSSAAFLAGRLTPAALTSTSSRSCRFVNASIARRSAASSARSHAIASTPFGEVPERLRPNTSAPASASPAAMASPIPRDAPVTMARRPCSEKRSRLRIAVAAHDGRAEPDVVGTVDLEHLVPLHHVHPDPAAESVFLFAKQARDEHVERTVFEVALFDLLAHAPVMIVVIDRFRTVLADAPVEIILDLADRQQAVELLLLERIERTVDIAGLADRRGGLQRDDALEWLHLGIDMLQRVQPRGLGGGEVAGDIFGASDADRAGGFRC